MLFIVPPPEIVDMPERAIIGLGGEYCLDTRGEIPKLWWLLQTERQPIHQGVRATTYGVFQTVPPGAPFSYYDRFLYIAGLAAEPDESERPPFHAVTLKGGRYAVFRFTGSYSEMTQAFDAVILNWLPQSDWQLDDREVVECYPGYKLSEKSLPVFEVWLPVTEKT